MMKKRTEYRILVKMPEDRRPLGRSRQGWVNNIKMNLKDKNGVVWTGLI
jgi:hypothetical protein